MSSRTGRLAALLPFALAVLAACAPSGPKAPATATPDPAAPVGLLPLAKPDSLYAGWSVPVPEGAWRVESGVASDVAVAAGLDLAGAAPLARAAGEILVASDATAGRALVIAEVNPTTEGARLAESVARQSGQVPVEGGAAILGRSLPMWRWTGGFGPQALAVAETEGGVRFVLLLTATEDEGMGRLLAALARTREAADLPVLR